MPTFAFSGRTRSGETVTGERVGDTIDAVVAMSFRSFRYYAKKYRLK